MGVINHESCYFPLKPEYVNKPSSGHFGTQPDRVSLGHIQIPMGLHSPSRYKILEKGTPGGRSVVFSSPVSIPPS